MNRSTVTTIAASTSVLAAVAITGASFAQDSGKDAMQNTSADGAIGVVEVQRVFEAYPATQEFNRQAQAMQQQFAQAQQQGNQDMLMQIQAKFQQMQQKLRDDFRTEMEAATRDIAKQNEVTLVVSDVIYSANGAPEVDLTPDVIDAVSGPAGVDNSEDQ